MWKSYCLWLTPLLVLLSGLLVAVAAEAQELFVADAGVGANASRVYSRTANGDIAPTRTISGASTGLDFPTGLALDLTNNELFVANPNANSITVYSRTANGDIAPTRTISGASTGLNTPTGLALDSAAAAPIPTLSEWAQLGMVALLLGGGLFALRRRRAEGHA
jgi:hypothetical protein